LVTDIAKMGMRAVVSSVGIVRASIVAAVILFASAWPAPGSPAAAFRHCSAPSLNAGQGPREDRFVPFGNVKVHHMTCSAALGAIRRGHLNPRFHTPGFACHVVKQYAAGPPGHAVITGQRIACRQRSRSFRWSWAT
jgi:hypothetical protein